MTREVLELVGPLERTVSSERVMSISETVHLLRALHQIQDVLIGRLETVPNPVQRPETPAKTERLLTVEEVAQRLGMTVPWVYRHAGKWSFTRRLSRKALRFSEAGLERWIESKKVGRTVSG